MRKRFNRVTFLVIIIFTASSIILGVRPLSAEVKERVFITTSDINKDYKIKGIVVYRCGFFEIDKIKKGLAKEAKKLDANYVISVRFLVFGGEIYCYGTAVKTKKASK